MKRPIALPPRLVNISEIFRSLQGEGGRVGHPSVFVRFSGCNLRCRWRNADGTDSLCDTPYTSFLPERKLMAFPKLLEQVQQALRQDDDLVITGGEPLLYPEAVGALIADFERRAVTIETNGTREMPFQGEELLYSVSPKLKNSGSAIPSQVIIDHVNDIRRAQIQLKFVCSNPSDIDEIEDFVSRLKVPASVFLMPLGSSSEEIKSRLGWIEHLARERGFLVTDRIHVHLWPGARGV